jgi:hypothetical protein
MAMATMFMSLIKAGRIALDWQKYHSVPTTPKVGKLAGDPFIYAVAITCPGARAI